MILSDMLRYANIKICRCTAARIHKYTETDTEIQIHKDEGT